MQKAHATPVVTLSAQPIARIDTDLLVVPFFEDDDLADEPELDTASGGEIAAARARGALTGKLYEVLDVALTFSDAPVRRAVLVGAGRRQDLNADRLRRLATTGALAARHRRRTRVAIVARMGTGVADEHAAQVLAEGATLANFDGANYKTGDRRLLLESAALRIPGAAPGLQAAVDRGCLFGECSNLARELANEPGNQLTPRVFAERGAQIGAAAGLNVEVLDEQRIAELEMGLLLGVARGSQEPPRLLILRHQPAQPHGDVVLGLVGKGITFETGGISIKPADNMDRMKDDMSGGAAVIGAMVAISRLKLPIRCLGIVPMTENMPGGKAVKPGDVLTSAAGKTVEILNTDAEGRLVLGDAIWLARELGATHLVDVATLTGACVVALGKTTSGLFGTPESWVEEVRKASVRAGDRSWPMPVFDDYKELLKSEIADFTNTGGRAAGAITGALFVKEFAGDLPWVHMDIAGTAWAEEPKPYQPKGATGVGVRTLAELALAAAAWSASPPQP
jgi:leucyl aminopeptidase